MDRKDSTTGEDGPGNSPTDPSRPPALHDEQAQREVQEKKIEEEEEKEGEPEGGSPAVRPPRPISPGEGTSPEHKGD
jgi:hypothetical protein